MHGRATIGDNRPLSLAALASCLDDELTPQAWLRMLNSRVFFWVDEARAARLADSARNRKRGLVVLVLRTESLVEACRERVELSAINSGATLRRAARRGLSTFVPLARHDFAQWRRLRGKYDRVCEVAIPGGVGDVAPHILDIRAVPPSRRQAEQM